MSFANHTQVVPMRANQVQMVRRFASMVCVAWLLLLYPATQAIAGIFVKAGDLAVDLRRLDLDGNSTSWFNRATGANSVGSFNTRAGNVSVASVGGFSGLFINNSGANSLVSTLTAPATLLGTSVSTTEAWVFNPGVFEASETIVSWGQPTGNTGTTYRGHRYALPGGGFPNGMFTAWFQDKDWAAPTDLIQDAWTHVAWVLNGDHVKGYVNGVLKSDQDLTPELDTSAGGITIGSRSTTSTAEGFKGYIASVRVHTGILSDADILSNFNAGIDATSTIKVCDFNADGDCDSHDFNTLRDHLFTNGGSTNGDLNGDGIIDLKDYRLFKDSPDRQFGFIGPAGTGALQFAVPEPASLTCLGIASVLLLSARRVRKSSH